MKWRRTAMQCPQCSSHSFWKDKRRDLLFKRLKVRTHTLRRSTPFILLFWDVSKASSSLTFLSVVRQSTEIELCKIEPFQSRAFQLCCERRLTPSACLLQILRIHAQSDAGGLPWVPVDPVRAPLMRKKSQIFDTTKLIIKLSTTLF